MKLLQNTIFQEYYHKEKMTRNLYDGLPILPKKTIIDLLPVEDIHELYQVKSLRNVVISPDLWKTIDFGCF